MGGFSSVTGLEAIVFADNASFDGTQRGGALTTDGQLFIGSTASPHIKKGILTSPDSSITIGYSSPNITLQAASGALTWTDKSINFNAAVSNGYFIIGSCTATLPSSPSNGNEIAFFVDGVFTLTVQANTGQTIKISSNTSSSAGTQVNTADGDALTLVYRSTNTRWEAINFVGAWNFT